MNSRLRDRRTTRRGDRPDDRRPSGHRSPAPGSAGRYGPAGPGRAAARRGPVGPDSPRHAADRSVRCRGEHRRGEHRRGEHRRGPRLLATRPDQPAGRSDPSGRVAGRSGRCRGACAMRLPTDWSGRPAARPMRAGRLHPIGSGHRRTGCRGEPIGGSPATDRPHCRPGRRPNGGEFADRTHRPAVSRPDSRFPSGGMSRRGVRGRCARAPDAGPGPVDRARRPTAARRSRTTHGTRNPGPDHRTDPRNAAVTSRRFDRPRHDRSSCLR